MSKLRSNLAATMAKKGWNAYDLERASAVPQPTIQRFLAGKHGEPRGSTVKKWADALGVTSAYLLGLDDHPEPDTADQAATTSVLGSTDIELLTETLRCLEAYQLKYDRPFTRQELARAIIRVCRYLETCRAASAEHVEHFIDTLVHKHGRRSR